MSEDATVELTPEQAERFNQLAEEIAPYGTAAPEDVVEYLLDYHDGDLKESMVLESAGPRPDNGAGSNDSQASGGGNGGEDPSTSAEHESNEGLTPEEKAEKFRLDDEESAEGVAELDADELSARAGDN